jgi:hypothetical protein
MFRKVGSPLPFGWRCNYFSVNLTLRSVNLSFRAKSIHETILAQGVGRTPSKCTERCVLVHGILQGGLNCANVLDLDDESLRKRHVKLF